MRKEVTIIFIKVIRKVVYDLTFLKYMLPCIVTATHNYHF